MTETRLCQNCKTDFVIADEDFNFYTKVEVPPPTEWVNLRYQDLSRFDEAKVSELHMFLTETPDGIIPLIESEKRW